MADLTEEEHLDTPTNIPSETPTDETIDIIGEKSNNESEAYTPMEVHHPKLPHQPKPWKEYFLEFIMLFLAVTLGFIAENIREKYIERHRAEEYMHSLYDDLKIDTNTIQRTINEKIWIQSKYDSVQNLLLAGTHNQNTALIYYVERYLSINDLFTSQDVTYQQLRSSGSFRYIKNVSLYKEIANYYNLYDRYVLTEPGFSLIRDKDIEELELKLFNVSQLQRLNSKEGKIFYTVISRPDFKPDPIKEDKENLDRFYLKVSEANLRARYNAGMLEWLKDSATDVLLKLKEEYHFE